jgi:hypothetical protein
MLVLKMSSGRHDAPEPFGLLLAFHLRHAVPGVVTRGQPVGACGFHLSACKLNGKRVGILRSRRAKTAGAAALASRELAALGRTLPA